MTYRFPYPKAASSKLLGAILIHTIPAPDYARTLSADGQVIAQPVIIGKARRALGWFSGG